MMGVSAVLPLAYALSKSKREFSFRIFIFNTRKRFALTLILNLLILSMVSYSPEVLDAVGTTLTFLFQIPAKPNVYFLSAMVGILAVIAIRGDSEVQL